MLAQENANIRATELPQEHVLTLDQTFVSHEYVRQYFSTLLSHNYVE